MDCVSIDLRRRGLMMPQRAGGSGARREGRGRRGDRDADATGTRRNSNGRSLMTTSSGLILPAGEKCRSHA
jgi:hypothetical protein